MAPAVAAGTAAAAAAAAASEGAVAAPLPLLALGVAGRRETKNFVMLTSFENRKGDVGEGPSALAGSAEEWAKNAAAAASRAAQAATYASQQANTATQSASNAVAQMGYLINHPDLKDAEALKQSLGLLTSALLLGDAAETTDAGWLGCRAAAHGPRRRVTAAAAATAAVRGAFL